MNDKKTYKVTIFGQEYTVLTDESESRLLQAAATVDALMGAIAEKGKIRDGQHIAVLAALRLSHIVSELEAQVQMHKDDEKRLIDSIDCALHSCTNFSAQ